MNKWFTDAIIIAGVTLLGYLTAFIIEVGYAIYHGIPYDLISLPLTKILAASFGILTILAIGFFFFGLTYSDPNRSFSETISDFFSALPAFVFLIIARYAIDGFDWRGWYYRLLELTFIFFVIFVVPMITQERLSLKDLKEQVGQSWWRKWAIIFRSLLHDLLRDKFLGVFCWALVFLWVCIHAGFQEGRDQKSYFIVDSSIADAVVLRFYGDTVVLHEYDPVKNELKGNLIVTKISEKHPLRLQKNELGHLTNDYDKKTH